jgi:hypothetical protein
MTAGCAAPDRDYLAAAWLVHNEAIRARAVFPPFNSAHEGYAVLLEEVDEMWDEVKRDQLQAAIYEAIQVGAMAVRFIADLEHRLTVSQRTVLHHG